MARLLAEEEEESLDRCLQALASGWLGFPAATEDQVARLEERLGKTLPLSYRSFLKVSNGFLQPRVKIPRLLSSEEVEWFHIRNRETIDMLRSYQLEDFSDTLLISARELNGSAVHLLDPNTVNADGEWEAITYAHWYAGAFPRYPSFWDLMQGEYKYSVLYRERGEGRLGRGEDLRVITVKFPSLIKALERKIRSLTDDPYLSGTEWSRDVLTVLKAAQLRVAEIGEKNRKPEVILQQLETLAVEFREKGYERAQEVLRAGLSREGRSDGIESGYYLAMGAIWWFLNGQGLNRR